MDTLDADLDTLDPLADTLNADLGTLDPLAGTLDADLDTLEPDLGTLDPLAGTLDADLDTLEPDLGTLDPLAGTLDADLDTLDADLGTLDPDLGTLDQREAYRWLSLSKPPRPTRSGEHYDRLDSTNERHAMTTADRRGGRRRLLATTAVALALASPVLAACTEQSAEPSSPPPSTSRIDHPVDPELLNRLVEAIEATGAPVTHEHVATPELCPAAGCDTAVAADQLILMQFPTSGRAELYAGAHAGSYQVLTVVLSFPAGVDTAQQQRYIAALQSVVR